MFRNGRSELDARLLVAGSQCRPLKMDHGQPEPLGQVLSHRMLELGARSGNCRCSTPAESQITELEMGRSGDDGHSCLRS